MARRKILPKDNDFLLIVLPFVAVGVLIFLFFSQRTKVQIPDSISDIPNTPLIVSSKKTDADMAEEKKVQKMQDNFQQLIKQINDQPGVYGLYIKDKNRSLEFKYNELNEFYAASLFKLPVAAATLKQIENNHLQKDTKITYMPLDYSEGTGVINSYNYGIQLKVDEVLTELLKNSDNTAQNMLLRTIQYKNVEDTFKALVPDASSSTFFRYNTSTPYEISYIIDKLYFGSYLTKDDRTYLKDLLIGTSFEDRISAYLKPNMKFSHKIGSWPETWHDCGVVYSAYNQVIVCLMSTKAPYEDYLNVAKLVGDFVSNNYD